jgi:DNA-binding transcriptional ArsR family regulator
MPRLSGTLTPKHTIEFVVSEPLDLMNAMYFTHLAGYIEGIEAWPKQVRTEMQPQLLEELDSLFAFPMGQPGVIGALADRLFAYPQTWRDVASLVGFVRQLPEGVGDWPERLGVQGLALYSIRTPTALGQRDVTPEASARETLRKLLEADGREVEPVQDLFERPAELRERMARLIERFYDEHYRQDLPRRLPCMERSVAANRDVRETDIAAFMRRLTGRPEGCEEDIRHNAFDRFIFVPSLDMGPYLSCGVIGRIHGLYYSCEAQSIQEGPEEEEMRRLARLYKALSDEQRLRILNMLREREMYAQEIVERTGLHQSVVSRHLTFMKAVGLLSERRQNNMKFYTIDPSIGEELGKTLSLFVPREANEGV